MIFGADFRQPSDNFVRSFTSDDGLEAAREELSKDGIFFAEVDGTRVVSDAALFDELKKVFRFPDYFGTNWDATLDCLRDLDWLPNIGYVMVVRHADEMFRNAPSSAARLIELCGEVAAFWRSDGRPFYLVLLLSANG